MSEMEKTVKAMTKITMGVGKIAAQQEAQKGKKGNPYREGGLRFAIFAAGSRGYKTRHQLAEKVAKSERHAAKKVEFQLAVVASPSHPGNQKRSKEVEKQGQKFLVAC